MKLLHFFVIASTAVVTQSCTEKKIYLLATAAPYGSDAYIDDNGTLAGFLIDLADEVCRAAGIDCRFVSTAWWTCWNYREGLQGSGGVGLLDGWFDGCIGGLPTYHTVQVFKFSQSFHRPFMSFFYVRSDFIFKKDDLKTIKIGFVKRYLDDEKCIARELGIVVPLDNVFYYNTPVQLVKALTSKKIDAMLVSEHSLRQPGIFHLGGSAVKKVETLSLSCAVRGGALMTRKDSDLPEKWNEGFSKIVSNGRLKELCEESNKKHVTDERPPPLCTNPGMV